MYANIYIVASNFNNQFFLKKYLIQSQAIYIGLKYYIITITSFWRCCIIYSFFDCRRGCSSISCNGDRRHNKLQYIIQRILKIYITATRNGTRRGYISRCVCVSTFDSFTYVQQSRMDITAENQLLFTLRKMYLSETLE